jgi:hypothetical protein
MMGMAVSDREFGELLGEVRGVRRDLEKMEKASNALDTKVDGILSRFDQIDGGTKVAIWFSGMIGALAMFGLTKIAPMIIGVLPRL